MEQVIELKNVFKIIKEQKLIDNVSLSVGKGQTVGFVGRNGSGKTVLLKLICGIYTATSGEIIVNGKTIGKEIDFPENIGIIIETPGFLPGISGYKNLKLLARINNKANNETIKKSLEFVGLNPDDKKKIGKYSLGMKQRLGLAQAIMEKPEILILDEPFNGMDQAGVAEMRSHLKSLKELGITMLIATHSTDDLEQLCDSVYEMSAGKLRHIR